MCFFDLCHLTNSSLHFSNIDWCKWIIIPRMKEAFAFWETSVFQELCSEPCETLFPNWWFSFRWAFPCQSTLQEILTKLSYSNGFVKEYIYNKKCLAIFLFICFHTVLLAAINHLLRYNHIYYCVSLSCPGTYRMLLQFIFTVILYFQRPR